MSGTCVAFAPAFVTFTFIGAFEALAAALGGAVKKRKLLNFGMWQVCFPSYNIGAAAVGQWHYTTGLVHRENCLEVAHQAGTQKRKQFLGVIYDDLCRRVVGLCWVPSAFGFSICLVAGAVGPNVRAVATSLSASIPRPARLMVEFCARLRFSMMKCKKPGRLSSPRARGKAASPTLYATNVAGRATKPMSAKGNIVEGRP